MLRNNTMLYNNLAGLGAGANVIAHNFYIYNGNSGISYPGVDYYGTFSCSLIGNISYGKCSTNATGDPLTGSQF